MINLQTKLNEEIKNAMKANEVLKRDTLRFLKGEMDRDRDREHSNAYISKLAKKLIDGIKEAQSDKGEIAILEEFIPQQISEEKLRELVKDFVFHSPAKPNMGQIMSYFKINYDGQYDGKILSLIAKEAAQ